ncbi:PRC-barrel domain-containing protein [Halocella sp. SP3-1]|uniref:PRC-barrel domain-containing protein n=1 Tax=Halocella sp. SP3-1 TaxID=2382161 RepID=UPI000F74C1D1|nr:PRC-barrel domain-containing protein [Halocella sp. SP3-1]AZO95526.1 hypothetical protein D7D81_13540 [Halocella sp. SP3-1]
MIVLCLNDLLGKLVIDIHGNKLGKIDNTDIIIENHHGEIESLILHHITSSEAVIIPFGGIKEVGSSVVVVDSKLRIN